MLDNILRYDLEAFYYINISLANKAFDFIIPIINEEETWIIPIIGLVAMLLFRGRKKARTVLLLVLLSVAVTDVFCYRLLKPAVGRKRPSHTLEDARIVDGRRGTLGFPSNHAANITVAVTVLSYYYRFLLIPGIVLIGVVAFGRVYVGVHYPLDVICGALIGMMIALTVIKAGSKLAPNFIGKIRSGNRKPG